MNDTTERTPNEISFKGTGSYLAQVQQATGRDGEEFLRAILRDLHGGSLPVDFNGLDCREVMDDMSIGGDNRYADSIKHLKWFDEDAVELHRTYGRGLSEAAARVDMNFDLAWLNIQLPGNEKIVPGPNAMQSLRDQIVTSYDLDLTMTPRDVIEERVVLVVTIDGPAYRTPDLTVLGPSRRGDSDEDGDGYAVNMLHFALSEVAEGGGGANELANALAELSALAEEGEGWKKAFKHTIGTLSKALKRELQKTMALFEDTHGRADNRLGQLREAASLLAFRAMFSMVLERRGRLYRNGQVPVAPLGDDCVEDSIDDLLAAHEQTNAGHPSGALLARIVHTARAIRGEVGETTIAVTGGSIFENQPPNFDDGVGPWLDALERAVDAGDDTGLLCEWDERVRHLGAIMLGHLDAEYRAEVNLIGSGAQRRRHRVLGNIYEQILAMIPGRDDSGRVELRYSESDDKKDDRSALGAHYTPAELVEEVVRPTLGHLFMQYWEEADRDVGLYRQKLREMTVVDPAMGSAHFLTIAALEIARELAWMEFFDEPRFAMLEDWEEPLLHQNAIGHDPELDEFSEDEADDDGDKKGGNSNDERGEDRFIEPERHRDFESEVRKQLPGVIRRSIYGVDINPFACELGKLSIWLFEVSEVEQSGGGEQDYPELTYLDANIRCGDSLVGVFLDDVEDTFEGALRSSSSFDGRQQTVFGLRKQSESVKDKIERAQLFRETLQTLPDNISLHGLSTAITMVEQPLDIDLERPGTGYQLERQVDRAMRDFMKGIRWIYDLTLAIRYIGYTSGSGKAKTGAMYEMLLAEQPEHGGTKDDRPRLENALRVLFDEPDSKAGQRCRGNLQRWLRDQGRLNPFHWETEFPAIFSAGGFDVLVANPPFIGSQRIKRHTGAGLQGYLGRYFFDGSTPEYAAFFFKRYARVLNSAAAFASLAPNTIAQGKVRRAAIPPLVSTDQDETPFEFFRACRNREWPGDANVHIAMVFGRRKSVEGAPKRLAYTDWEEDETGDTHRVIDLEQGEGISSYLDELPDYELDFLEATRTLSSLQYYDDVKPLVITGFNIGSEFKRCLDFIDDVPASEKDAIYAYYNNSTVKNQPKPQARELVIDFTDQLRTAGKYEQSVKKQRDWLQSNYEFVFKSLKGSVSSASGAWWELERDRLALRDAWKNVDEVVVFGDVSKCWTPQIIPKTDVKTGLEIRPTIKLYVLPNPDTTLLGVVTSAVFENHLRRTSSTLKSDLSVVPSEAFPTFPMPWESKWSHSERRPVVGQPPAAAVSSIEPPMREILSLRRKLLDSPPSDFKDCDSGDWGITKLYNNFDDPQIEGSKIDELRAAHRALFDGVARAFGWDELVGCEWDFERPWLDGSPRYVPIKPIRAKIFELIDRENTQRRRQEDRLYCERISEHIPPSGLSTNQVSKLNFVKSLPIPTSTNDVLEEILESGAEQGVIEQKGNKWHSGA